MPSKDPKTKTRNVFWAQWDKYLQQYFNPIPNLSKYHHFKFFEDGSIKTKLYAYSDEVEIRKAKTLESDVLPLNFIEPDGISEQRAWYLFNEIRLLCYKESCKDLVAPQPKIAQTKSKQKTAAKTSTDSVGQKTKAKVTKKDQKSSKIAIDNKKSKILY